VLKTILCGLPKTLSVPVFVVQHMAKGFIGSFADWMNQACELPVHLAADGMLPIPGHIYIAPDDFHMTVTRKGIALVPAEADTIICPSISHLFRSVAEVYGKHAVGVLLSGMGKDGAEELKRMEQLGALTMVQDAESSVVYGMAREAVRLGAATYEFSPEQLALTLNTLLVVQAGNGKQG
jgi:two-component system chemotaxis response regulator CheB